MMGSGGAGTHLLTPVISDRSQGNRMKLSQGRFSLAIRRRFLTEQVVEHWNKVSSEVVTALILFGSKNDHRRMV